MIRYIIQRILAAVLIILAVIFVVYGVIWMAPGDPATMMLGVKATPEAVAELNAELGYDKPFLIQYGNYISNLVFHQDMGTSFKYGTKVWSEIAVRFPKSLILASFAVLVEFVLAIGAGILCVKYKGRAADKFFCTLSGILTAIPSYASGLILMIVFSVWLGVTPIYGVKTAGGYILPIIALAMTSVGYLTKTVRSVTLDVLGQDYIRTARAIGETERRIIYAYAVRNALLPIVTAAAYQYVSMLAGTVMVESVFSINGIGTLMVDAVLGRDIPLMLGIIIVLTAAFCLVQLLMELSYLVLDPRVRAKYDV